MHQRITIQHTPDGPLVVKRADNAQAGAALRHEGRILQQFAHPGLVEFVRVDTANDTTTLITRCAGSASLADHRPASVASAIAIMASAFGTLADLHEVQLVHGNLSADHLILTAQGRPVLCSLGHAEPVSAAGPHTSDDMRQMGAVLAAIVARTPTPSSRRERTAHQRQLRTVGQIVAAISGPVESMPTAREAARQLAEASRSSKRTHLSDDHSDTQPDIHAAPRHATSATSATSPISDMPTTTLMGTRTWRHRIPSTPPTPQRTMGNGSLTLVAIVLAAICGIIGTQLVRSHIKPMTVPQQAAPTTTTGTEPAAQATTEPRPPGRACATAANCEPGPEPCKTAVRNATTAVDPTQPTSTTELRADVDGDGCPDQIRVEGNLVFAHDTWFRAGEPDDLVAVGDWDCDGLATPAILRPETGDVFIFGSWAHDGTAVDVGATTRVIGAFGVSISTDASGCQSLVVHSTAGDQAMPHPKAG